MSKEITNDRSKYISDLFIDKGISQRDPSEWVNKLFLSSEERLNNVIDGCLSNLLEMKEEELMGEEKDVDDFVGDVDKVFNDVFGVYNRRNGNE